jgi:hypothetical protein
MDSKRLTEEREKEIRGIGEHARENCHWGHVSDLLNEIDALRSDLEEECRINGMGASRELKMMTEKDILKRALENARTQLAMYRADHSVQKCDEALEKVSK